MVSITSTRYLSNVDWLQDVVQGTDLILCGVSALEYLELFNGYVNESIWGLKVIAEQGIEVNRKVSCKH